MSSALDNTFAGLEALARALGPDGIVTEHETLRLYSEDVYTEGHLVRAVLRPHSVEALAAALKVAADEDLTVIARGGGMSYTDAYLARNDHTVLVDTARLDRIVEINTDDMYVTVECGITWCELDRALAEHDVRTPYWGPLSGLRATVGGALSQGSIFLGSGRHGSVADNVLSLEVLTANGERIATGSRVNSNAAPFFRHYGPDLTGLFTGDCGALGIKVRATLPLKRRLPHTRFASFGFADARALIEAMNELAREDIVSECFAFDPGLGAQRLKRTSLAEDVKSLGRVMRSAGGALKGVREGLKVVTAGRDFLDGTPWSCHVIVDGRSTQTADEKLTVARRVCGERGKEVENTIPKVMRADPFANVNSLLGPLGERWVPVHGIVPFSGALPAYEAMQAVIDGHQARLDELGIEYGTLMCTIGTSAFLVEPCLYWQDSQGAFHKHMLDDDYLAKLNDFPANPDARALVHQLRLELTDRLHDLGATHFQIGKFYPYGRDADPGARALLEAVKRHTDPDGRLNPGALGLD